MCIYSTVHDSTQRKQVNTSNHNTLCLKVQNIDKGKPKVQNIDKGKPKVQIR